MMAWWNGLDVLTHVFFSFALFFGVLFIWQFVAMILGLGGHGDLVGHDVGGGHDAGSADTHDGGAHGDASGASFHLLSFRSILAFFTLFWWYGALTLMNKGGTIAAVAFGLVWGLAAMVAVALAFYLMGKATESGNSRIETCLGTVGSVYADIPAGGMGQVRCTVSGCITMVKARGSGGQAIKAGTPVQILGKIDDTSVEVQPTTQTAQSS
jgi:membrane protein implicated in regulation of membrane protease activity